MIGATSGRQLPTGKQVSALGFGCSSLWAKPMFDFALAMDILDVLAAEGVNHFDTGPSYGNGEGERRLGQWIARRDRDGMVLTTKVGTNLIGGNIIRGFDPGMMEQSFRDSLTRLETDYVDILYLHGPAESDLNDRTFAFLEDLKDRGLIRLAGINSFDNAVLAKAIDSPFDAAMLQYNIGDFRNATLIDRLRDAGKTVLSGTALSRAKYDLSRFIPTSREKAWYMLRMLRNEPGFLLSGWKLARCIKATGMPPHEAAIRFLTSDMRITSSLFGTTSVAHARDNVVAGRKTMPQEVWTRLQTCA